MHGAYVGMSGTSVLYIGCMVHKVNSYHKERTLVELVPAVSVSHTPGLELRPSQAFPMQQLRSGGINLRSLCANKLPK